MTIWKRHK